MIVIFNGLESLDNRTTLLSVRQLFDEDKPPLLLGSVSYRGLRRRRMGGNYIKETCHQLPVVLEPGSFNAQWTRDEALEQQDEYYTFLETLPEVLSAVQFEHPSLEVSDMVLPTDPRVIPVLPQESDMKRLTALLDDYGSVAMDYKGDKRVPAILRSRAANSTLRLALNQSDLEAMKQSGFDAVMTSAWLTPGKYGEPVVWDGRRVNRHKASVKTDYLRERGKWLDEQGFDVELLANDDAREWNRLAVYSYLLWSAALGPDVSDTSQSENTPPGSSSSSVSEVSAAEPAKKTGREKIMLPVFSSSTTTSLETDDDGVSALRSRPTLLSGGQTLRVCDTCYLSSTCPAFEAGASCRFDLPVEVRTEAQAKALMYTMLEIQAARVAFARFAEEVNGGYPDPVVGQEMDRLMRVTAQVTKPMERRERLTVSVESETINTQGSGVLSRIFGGSPAPAVEQPKVIEVIEQS